MLNWHFFLLRVSPLSENFLNTACKAWSWSAWQVPNTMTSSLMFSAPGMSRNNSWMMCWNISLAELVPKFNRAYRRSPLCVAKVVMYRLSGASDSWWYPALKSSLEKTVDPFRVCVRSSTVGLGWRSRWMAWLALLMSTHMQASPFFFGVATNGETHGVGPSTFSMIPCFSRFSSSCSTFFLMWNGMRRCGWATGGTDCIVTKSHWFTVRLTFSGTVSLSHFFFSFLT